METPGPKQLLRRELRARRAALADRAARSAAICARAAALPAFTAATAIHCYLAIRSEVDTRPLIGAALARGKAVAVPVLEDGAAVLSHAWLDDLEESGLLPGGFGTFRPRLLRPAYPGDWQLVLVPLLGFDRRGYRLGYGQGFYDRLLAAAPTVTVGLAFAIQEVESVPAEPHDIPLAWIVTEDETLRCR